MKYKHIVAVLILGLMCWFFGYWARITHQAYAYTVFTIAITVILLSGILALIKIFFFTDKDSTLNK
jgi:Na+/melibiose symporter-like transporter